MNLQQKLKEAEALVAAVRKELDKEEKVNPLFPNTDDSYTVGADGTIYHLSIYFHGSRYRNQGNTFRTEDEAEKEVLRRAAMVRLLEKINIANKGNNGFITGKNNITLRLDTDNGVLYSTIERTYRSVPSAFYFRKPPSALFRDKEFVEDYKLYLGVG